MVYKEARISFSVACEGVLSQPRVRALFNERPGVERTCFTELAEVQPTSSRFAVEQPDDKVGG